MSNTATKILTTATMVSSIALFAGLASASAAEKFTTLNGVSAEPMNVSALANTVGSHLSITSPGAGFVVTVDINHNADGGPNEVLGTDVASGDLSACGGGALCNAFANVRANFPVSKAASADILTSAF